MEKLLHIDDNKAVLDGFRSLFSQKYDLTSESNSLNVEHLLEQNKYDGILIDVHMPYVDGSEILKLIRSDKLNKNSAVFMLSMDNTLDTRLSFIRDGVSDYISKEMDSQEIIHRVDNGIRFTEPENFIDIGNLKFDKFHLSLSINNEDISTTLIEYKILLFLINADFKVQTRKDLVEFVWNGAFVDKNVLNTHLYNLKNKLSEWDHEIKSIRLKGIKIQRKKAL